MSTINIPARRQTLLSSLLMSLLGIILLPPFQVAMPLQATGLSADTGEKINQKQEIFLLDKRPHIVFLITKDPANYGAHESIPEFARMLGEKFAYRVSVLKGEGDPRRFNFPGLKAVIHEADLLVIFFRRRALSHQQMNSIKIYLDSGKPLIGLRTASHAFSMREDVAEGYEDWWDFVPDILGCGYYDGADPELGAYISLSEHHSEHPIIEGIDPAWHSSGVLYKVSPIDKNATVLAIGRAGNISEPVAWTRNAGGSRIFYTSLGNTDDFKMPQFRQLFINGIKWALGE